MPHTPEQTILSLLNVTILNKKSIKYLLFIALIGTVTNVYAWGKEEKAFSRKLSRNLDKIGSEPQYAAPIETLNYRIEHLRAKITANSQALKEALATLASTASQDMSLKSYRTALYTKNAVYNRLHRSVRWQTIMLAQLEVLKTLLPKIKDKTSETDNILILHHAYNNLKDLRPLALHLKSNETEFGDAVTLLDTHYSRKKRKAQPKPGIQGEFDTNQARLLRTVKNKWITSNYHLFE